MAFVVLAHTNSIILYHQASLYPEQRCSVDKSQALASVHVRVSSESEGNYTREQKRFSLIASNCSSCEIFVSKKKKEQKEKFHFVMFLRS